MSVFFQIPDALNPRTWTAGELVVNHVATLEDVIRVLAIVVEALPEHAQVEVVEAISRGMERVA